MRFQSQLACRKFRLSRRGYATRMLAPARTAPPIMETMPKLRKALWLVAGAPSVSISGAALRYEWPFPGTASPVPAHRLHRRSRLRDAASPRRHQQTRADHPKDRQATERETNGLPPIQPPPIHRSCKSQRHSERCPFRPCAPIPPTTRTWTRRSPMRSHWTGGTSRCAGASPITMLVAMTSKIGEKP